MNEIIEKTRELGELIQNSEMKENARMPRFYKKMMTRHRHF